MIEKLKGQFTRYEIARILGARSLQLSMNAPVLLKMSKEEEENLNYDSLKIAERELESGVLPITVRRPLPKKSKKTVKKLSEEEIRKKLEKEAKEKEKEVKEEEKNKENAEKQEEKEIKEGAEIMEIANPDDENEEENEGGKEI